MANDDVRAVRALLRRDPQLASRILRLLALDRPLPAVVGSAEAAAAFAPILAGLDVEHLAVLAVDRRLRPIGEALTLSVGSPGFTIVDPVTILRHVLRQDGAHGFFMAHNHPSGDPSPSVQDIDVTRRVAAAARAVGVQLFDHLVVVSSERYTSLAERGVLPPVSAPAPSVTAA